MTQSTSGMPKVWAVSPNVDRVHHTLCPGCGEPIAGRLIGESLAELGLTGKAIYVSGIGCHGSIKKILMVDRVAALHGRAPSVATGIKRVRPQNIVFTIQGDGDMVSEGLQEVIHCAARGENITLFLVNNAVFGETGGQMTATTMLGQKTKSTPEGRSAKVHGNPIKMAELMTNFEGVAYSARVSVHTPAAVSRAKRAIKKALQVQTEGNGLSFVEVLTMCPTNWSIEPWESPKYIDEKMLPVFPLGEFKGA